jgi:hypothetical protein
VEEGREIRGLVDQELGSGFAQLRFGSDSPGHADGYEAEGASRVDVVVAVADHGGRRCRTRADPERGQRAGGHLALRLTPRGVQGRTRDRPEQGAEPQPLEDRAGELHRFRGRDREREAMREGIQHVLDPADGRGVAQRGVAVALAVARDAGTDPALVHGPSTEQPDEDRVERVPDQGVEVLLRTRREPALLERVIDRARDREARVHQHAVEVEEDGAHPGEGRRGGQGVGR